MRLHDLREITELAAKHYALTRAERQCEICYSQPWACGANGHSIAVSANDMGKVFYEMRVKLEKRLNDLGVTEFEQTRTA